MWSWCFMKQSCWLKDLFGGDFRAPLRAYRPVLVVRRTILVVHRAIIVALCQVFGVYRAVLGIFSAFLMVFQAPLIEHLVQVKHFIDQLLSFIGQSQQISSRPQALQSGGDGLKTIYVAPRLVPIAFRTVLGCSMILSNCYFKKHDQSETHKDVSGSVYQPSRLLYIPPEPVSKQPRQLHKPLGPLYVQPGPVYQLFTA